MKIAIASLAVGHLYRFACLEGKKSKEQYCKKQGYDFIYATKSENPSCHPSWSKIKLLQRILQHYDWVLYLDADTVIMDDTISVDSLIDSNYSFQICRESVGTIQNVNAGVFLIKNTPLMHQFLDDIWSRDKFTGYSFWEQSAIWQILEEENPYASEIKILSQNDMNSFAWEVCLPIGADQSRPGVYQEGDFLVHFAMGKLPMKPLLVFLLMKKYIGKLVVLRPVIHLFSWVASIIGTFHPIGKKGNQYLRGKILAK